MVVAAVEAEEAKPGAVAAEGTEVPTPITIEEINPIIKIVQISPVVKIKIRIIAKSLIKRVLVTVRMSPTTRAAVTGRKAGTRPTAPTPSSAAGCTSSLLAVPRIERLASLTSLKIKI